MLIFIGLPMVISTYLSVTLIGVVIFTCGLVIVHSVAFGWVGALAHADRAEASIMYVACCYLRRIRIGPRISSLRVVFLTLWMEGIFLFSTILAAIVAGQLAITALALIVP